MKLHINSQNENKLFERKEIKAEVSFEAATPTRKDIKAEIGGKLGADQGLIVLRQVDNEFGMKKIDVLVHVYSNADAMKKFEPRHIMVRDGLAEKKAKKEKKKTAA